MTDSTIYTYAWDLAELGVAAATTQFRQHGIGGVTLATAYHAGKFLRPHGVGGKVYFPQDGTVYFRPEMARYGEIKPLESDVTRQHDVLAELVAAGVPTTAWMVLNHNSRIGMAHPRQAVANAFGDRYIYSLCPANPEVRSYGVALCKDLTDHYGVAGVALETPGFLPYAHGYHHEFALVKSNPWLENLLGLCFCEHCMAGAQAAGIDAEGLKRRVARDIAACLDADFDLPPDMAAAFWLADVAGDGDLAAFLAWRGEVTTSLVAEIRAEIRPDAELAVIPSVARRTGGAFHEGTDLGALAAARIIIEACFYEPSAERVRADLFDVRRRIGNGRLRGIVRPAHPDLASRTELVAAVAALRAGGVETISFYNWGHVKQQSLEWIGAALRGQ
ncbi:MAG: hypothetical protein IPK28_01030 [Devosia sp.]|nr:hypothetical protein [Devosia sp.]